MDVFGLPDGFVFTSTDGVQAKVVGEVTALTFEDAMRLAKLAGTWSIVPTSVFRHTGPDYEVDVLRDTGPPAYGDYSKQELTVRAGSVVVARYRHGGSGPIRTLHEDLHRARKEAEELLRKESKARAQEAAAASLEEERRKITAAADALREKYLRDKPPSP